MNRESDDQIITLDAMMAAIREKVRGNFDLVVGVERGGVLPAYLASRWLDRPMASIRIRFRDDEHRPLGDAPVLLRGLDEPVRGRRILLADDVGNTGATLRRAAEALEGAEITTLVISGRADISLFGPHDRCIRWPWHRDS